MAGFTASPIGKKNVLNTNIHSTTNTGVFGVKVGWADETRPARFDISTCTAHSGAEVMLFAPSPENIIDTATYVVHMAQPYDSTKNFLAMAPAKNCTVKNAPGKPGTGEHIVQLSVPEVIAGEPVVYELTWALKNDEYERFMEGAGKWLVTYQY